MGNKIPRILNEEKKKCGQKKKVELQKVPEVFGKQLKTPSKEIKSKIKYKC